MNSPTNAPEAVDERRSIEDDHIIRAPSLCSSNNGPASGRMCT